MACLLRWAVQGLRPSCYNTVMSPEDVFRTANNIDPDQTAPQEQSDLGLHCLHRPTCPNIYNLYGNLITRAVVKTQDHGVSYC